jgi:hypothetical protein
LRESPVQGQDDSSTIAAKVQYVPTLHGSSQAVATPLTTGPSVSGTTTGTATGIVLNRGVANFFNFTAAAGPASITGKVCPETTPAPTQNVFDFMYLLKFSCT